MNAAKIRKEWESSIDFPFEFSDSKLFRHKIQAGLLLSDLDKARATELTQEEANIYLGKFEYHYMNKFEKASLGAIRIYIIIRPQFQPWERLPEGCAFFSLLHDSLYFTFNLNCGKMLYHSKWKYRFQNNTHKWHLGL